ncbi:MAG: efflux RND transporter periplasmic adaptor subunit, partial [Bacteroidales bacterium]|nr:efflux RND transporter periplasmic adaptor subunit [Candidatus Colimorpha onthohippi]
MKRCLWIFGVALLLVSCKSKIENHDSRVVVSVMRVGDALQAGTSSAFGICYVGQVASNRSTSVFASCTGTLTRLHVRQGQHVAAGQVLASIHSETLQSAYDISRASLEQAQDAFGRAKQVYDAGGMTELKWVEVKTKLAQAEAAERASRRQLEDCKVVAPYSGVVGELVAVEGMHVTPATLLGVVVDAKSVEVDFSVPENELSAIKVGQPLNVYLPAIGDTLSAEVTVKGVVASQLAHAYNCVARFMHHSSQVMPGMTCKVYVKQQVDKIDKCATACQNLVVIPSSAVMTDVDGRYVWVVDADSIVQRRYVTIGGYEGRGVVVTEGLQNNEFVIVEGFRKVSTGMN